MATGKRARLGGFLVLVTTSAMAVSARAQPVPRDPVTAEALFEEGKRLMQAKDYGAACPKLAESQRLDPSGGTVLALALCYEAAGMTATAWATFNEAVAEARRTQRTDRETAALEHVHNLEKRLTRLRIDVPHPVPDLEIMRNGVPVGKVLWATAIPIDPGKYTFEAHAPGKVAWKWSIHIDRPGEVFAFPVPELANVPVAPVDAAVSTSAPGHKKSYLLPEIGLGLAIVSAGIAAGFVGAAASEWSTAKADTTSARANESHTAGTEADVATGLFVVSGVAAAASAVLLAVIATSDDSPKSDKPRTGLTVAPMMGGGAFGLSIGGSL